ILDPVTSTDASVSQWFAAMRTPSWDAIAVFGSQVGDTVTIIVIAAVAVALLALGRWLAQAAFIAASLAIEASAALISSTVVGRPRPLAPHLETGPPTSSFPSGHTAAAIVLYVGLAIVATTIVRALIVRLLTWI